MPLEPPGGRDLPSIASGKTNQQIERELFIASARAHQHLRKCDVHSRKELIALCGGE
ncbi:MAG: hypothetical protein ACLUE1_00785 [Adlercreutzia equolifaciens]